MSGFYAARNSADVRWPLVSGCWLPGIGKRKFDIIGDLMRGEFRCSIFDTGCFDIQIQCTKGSKDTMNLIAFLGVLCELCVSEKPKKSLEFSR
jgi:hypothetical protein